MTDLQKYPQYAGLALTAFVILFTINETFGLVDVGNLLVVLAGILGAGVIAWTLWKALFLIDVDALAPRKPH